MRMLVKVDLVWYTPNLSRSFLYKIQCVFSVAYYRLVVKSLAYQLFTFQTRPNVSKLILLNLHF